METSPSNSTSKSVNPGQQGTMVRVDNRFVLGALIFALAWFVGFTFRTQSICTLGFLLAILGGMIGDKWRRRYVTSAGVVQRGIWGVLWRGMSMLVLIIGSLWVVFMWRMAHQVSESASLLLLTVDMIAHYGIAVLCILWSIWPQRGHVLMLLVALIVIVMTVAGGGVSTSLTAQTAVGLATVVGFVFAAQIILARQRHHVGSFDDGRLYFRSEVWPYALLILSVVLIGASTLVQVTDSLLPSVQAEVFAQLKDRFETADSSVPVSSGGYVSGSYLGNVQQIMLSDPNGLALRGYCAGVPGYLRGNVFDDYSQRNWKTRRRWLETDNNGQVRNLYRVKSSRPLSVARVPLKKPANRSRSRFSLSLWGADDVPRKFVGSVEIHGEPGKGTIIFLPATTMWMEARADTIGITSHGLVERGVDSSQPWVAGVAISPQRERLTAGELSLLTSVDPILADEIEKVADVVCRGADSPTAKVRRIADYFQKNYRYTLATESPPQGVDPIVHFLKTQHPAHCELFASAVALMLRTQGVPSRYVTGYVMDELSDSEDYYLARNRDAHAWVEYYDDQQQTWVSLESTPGREYQTLEIDNGTAQTTLADQRALELESATLGWLRRLWGSIVSLRVTDALSIVFRILQMPLLIGLVLWLWWRKRQIGGDAEAVALAAARRTMDRRMRRRGWNRRPSETLHQFADRLEQPAGKPDSEKERQKLAERAAAAQWYRVHAVELFRKSVAPANTADA